jgi:hypothetical protein
MQNFLEHTDVGQQTRMQDLRVQHAAGPGTAHVVKPANSTGSGNSQRFCAAHSQLDSIAVPAFGTQQGESVGCGLKVFPPSGDTDKSAADILLSLRGR